MTTPSPLQGWLMPSLADTANIETAVHNLVGSIERQSVLYFDTIAARNAIILAPVRGMLAWVDSIGAFTFYTGSVWKVLGVLPAGTIVSTIGATADVGFILLDGGTTVNAQTLYPELWARLPATWKSGSSMVAGDYRGRAVVGAGTGAGLTARTLGNFNIGEESHLLTTTESGTAVHTHGITDPQHAHIYNDPENGVPGQWGTGSMFVTVRDPAQSFTQGASTGITINNHAGSSAAAAHNNMQPSAFANWQIKAH